MIFFAMPKENPATRLADTVSLGALHPGRLRIVIEDVAGSSGS